MNVDQATHTPDEAWEGGFVCGLLTARYYALRHGFTDDFYRAAAPTATPDIVHELLSSVCRASIDRQIFEESWAALDHLLLCESSQELKNALAMVPDRTLQ